MNNGWIKTYRKTTDNTFCKGNAEKFGFWGMLLLKANHKENEFYFGNEKIVCKEGQFITGRKVLSEEMGVSEMKCERWLKCLESEQQIKQDTTNKYRLITILNWEKYQGDNDVFAQQTNNKRTTNEQQTNTNKNDKNVKNIYTEHFNYFWSIFPKKINKVGAFKVWQKIKPDTELAREICKKVRTVSRTEQWIKDNGQFIPYPTTYLNGRRWEDEIKINSIKEIIL